MTSPDGSRTRVYRVQFGTEARAAPEAAALTLDLQAGGDLVVVPLGAATTAAELFGGTDVRVVWRYNRAAAGLGSLVYPRAQPGGLPHRGRRRALGRGARPPRRCPRPGRAPPGRADGGRSDQPPPARGRRPRPRAGGGGHDGGRSLRGHGRHQDVWKFNRATRAWDLSYVPARGRGGFPIAPGDVLWVVAPRAPRRSGDRTAGIGRSAAGRRRGLEAPCAEWGAASRRPSPSAGPESTIRGCDLILTSSRRRSVKARHVERRTVKANGTRLSWSFWNSDPDIC